VLQRCEEQSAGLLAIRRFQQQYTAAAHGCKSSSGEILVQNA
jgi:hypothetical protein